MYSLKLDSGFTPTIEHSLASLRPQKGTVMTYNRSGQALSLFEHDEWLLLGPNGRTLHIQYAKVRDAASRSTALGRHNVLIAKWTMGNVLYGQGARSFSSMVSAWSAVRRLGVLCSTQAIRTDTISANEDVFSEWLRCGQSERMKLRSIAASVLLNESELGFRLFSPAQLDAISRVPKKIHHQTPYIPSRLHDRLLAVCHDVVERYLQLQESVSSAYNYALSEYKVRRYKRPGVPEFIEGIPDLAAELRAMRCPLSPVGLVAYLSDVRKACFILLGSYTLARKGEVLKLKSDCYSEHQDSHMGLVAMIESCTTKTQHNDHALFITSPRAKPALEALRLIANLVHGNRESPLSDSYFLFGVLPTPLMGRADYSNDRLSTNAAAFTGNSTPAFLQTDDFTITEDDFKQAIAVTPTLKRAHYSAGSLWRFFPHQLRRSMMIQCAASGLVSSQSLSFQAHHNSENMTWHYIDNYWHIIRTSGESGAPLSKTDELIAKEFSDVYVTAYNQAISVVRESDRFFSPYGEKHKKAVTRSIPLYTLKDVQQGERTGVVSRTHIGLCAYKGFCENRTAKSVKGCLTKDDGKPCHSALIDDQAEEQIKRDIEGMQDQLDALKGNPRADFKIATLEADIAYGHEARRLIKAHKRARR